MICKVSSNITQSLTLIDLYSYTKVNFNLIEIDTYNGWNYFNNSYRIPITGYYFITAHILLGPTTNIGSNQLLLRRNDGEVINGVHMSKLTNANDFYPILFSGFTIFLNKNDDIYLDISTNMYINIWTDRFFNWFNIVLLTKI